MFLCSIHLAVGFDRTRYEGLTDDRLGCVLSGSVISRDVQVVLAKAKFFSGYLFLEREISVGEGVKGFNALFL